MGEVPWPRRWLELREGRGGEAGGSSASRPRAVLSPASENAWLRLLDCRGDLSDMSLRRKREGRMGMGAGTVWIFTRTDGGGELETTRQESEAGDWRMTPEP